MDYRTRVYAKYASCFKDCNARFDAVAAERWGGAFERYLRNWLPERKDATIVDLACGNGSLLHFFIQRGYARLSGIDISKEQVALARQVLPSVIEGDVLAFLDANDATFELITAMDIIEHLTKGEALRFLDGCARALKPGGRLILQTPNADSPCFNSIRHGDFTHEVGFTPDSLGRLLKLCGLENVEARETGPVPTGLLSIARTLIWKGIRLAAMIWNLAETGAAGSGILTRVFLISGCKPAAPGERSQAYPAD